MVTANELPGVRQFEHVIAVDTVLIARQIRGGAASTGGSVSVRVGARECIAAYSGVKMRVTVQSATPNGLIVESGIGQISGQWREPSPTPRAGQWLDVEFNIDWVTCRAEVIDAEGLTASLRIESETNFVVGCMESIDDDDMGCLRLAQNCIVLVETDGALIPGDWVRMKVPSSSTEIFGSIAVDRRAPTH